MRAEFIEPPIDGPADEPMADDWDEIVERVPNEEQAKPIDLVHLYLEQIGRTALLTAAQEVELAKAIEVGVLAREKLENAQDQTEAHAETGADAEKEDAPVLDKELRRDLGILARRGEQAKNHMVEANLRLVVSVARKYRWYDVDLLDIVQEGNKGLIRAVEKFDYTRGYKFSTYASWWIRQSIERSMGEMARPVRLPAHLHTATNGTMRTVKKLEDALGRAPTHEEVAQELNIPVDKVELHRFWGDRPVVSMDTPVGNKDEDKAALSDILADDSAPSIEDQVANNDALSKMRGLIQRLDEPERVVIEGRFGLDGRKPRTYDQLGRMLKVSKGRVSSIEAAALKKLQNFQETA